MKHIYAPWRMSYIQSPEKPKGCIFCLFPKEKDDAKNLIVKRGDRCFVILNRYPYNSGHVMIVPYRHTADYRSLSSEEVAEIHHLASQAMDVLEKAFRPEGYNLGMNLGKVAGAGVDSHLHLHIVPRWSGDTNFISVLGDNRVVPQPLEETYGTFVENWPK